MSPLATQHLRRGTAARGHALGALRAVPRHLGPGGDAAQPRDADPHQPSRRARAGERGDGGGRRGRHRARQPRARGGRPADPRLVSRARLAADAASDTQLRVPRRGARRRRARGVAVCRSRGAASTSSSWCRPSRPSPSVGLAFLFVGALVWRLKPDRAESWAFLLFSCCMATGLFSSVLTYDAPAGYERLLMNLPLIGATALHLFTVFPSEPPWVARHRRVRLAPYALAAAVGPAGVVRALHLGTRARPAGHELHHRIGLLADRDRDPGARARPHARLAADRERRHRAGRGGAQPAAGADAVPRAGLPAASRCRSRSAWCGSSCFPIGWPGASCAASSSTHAASRAPRRPTAPRRSRSPACSRS